MSVHVGTIIIAKYTHNFLLDIITPQEIVEGNITKKTIQPFLLAPPVVVLFWFHNF